MFANPLSFELCTLPICPHAHLAALPCGNVALRWRWHCLPLGRNSGPCLGPVVTGLMLTQHIYWKMVGECHSRCSLDCAAQNRFILGWWDWAGSARPTWPPSCLSTCLGALTELSHVDWAWQMSILSSTAPTGLLEAVCWAGTSFPQLLLSSSDDMVHACQWVTQLVTHSLRAYI